MKTRFVVYCAPRTGSYHLTSLLDSAPDIVCHGEIYKPKAVELRAAYKEKLPRISTEKRDAHPFRLLRRLQDIHNDENFGFKLFRQHVRRVPQLKRLLKSPKWKKIALYRDPIEVYASLLRAQHTQRWTKKSDRSMDRSDLDVQVHFTEESLQRFMHSYNGFLGSIRRNQDLAEWFVIRYDQINDPLVLSSVLTFLGSGGNAFELTSLFEKQYDRPLPDAFDNWDELSAYVAQHSPFAANPKPTIGV